MHLARNEASNIDLYLDNLDKHPRVPRPYNKDRSKHEGDLEFLLEFKIESESIETKKRYSIGHNPLTG